MGKIVVSMLDIGQADPSSAQDVSDTVIEAAYHRAQERCVSAANSQLILILFCHRLEMDTNETQR